MLLQKKERDGAQQNTANNLQWTATRMNLYAVIENQIQYWKRP